MCLRGTSELGGHQLFLPTLFLRSRHLLEIGTRASRPSERVLGRSPARQALATSLVKRAPASTSPAREALAISLASEQAPASSPARQAPATSLVRQTPAPSPAREVLATSLVSERQHQEVHQGKQWQQVWRANASIKKSTARALAASPANGRW